MAEQEPTQEVEESKVVKIVDLFGENAAKKKKKKLKYVEVKSQKNHNCEINKVPYNLVKGEKYKVSEFAENVLARAGIV